VERREGDDPFDGVIRDSWGGDGADSGQPSGAISHGALQLPDGRWCERRADRAWFDSDTRADLGPEASSWLEGVWQRWAAKLPEAVRKAVEGDGGGEAGVREPRHPLPSTPPMKTSVDGD
jgi:hypothetical protein